MSGTVPVDLWPDPAHLGALTDLYQITMMAGYYTNDRDKDRATFEMFVRKLPKGRAYLVLAGLEQAIADLLRLRFSAEQVEGIRRILGHTNIDPEFFAWLTQLRFDGDVWAVPEGSVVFGGEPLIRVEASLAVAQWVETFLLASIGYPTLVASKAARVVEAAAGRLVFDFGLRRGHGATAGMLAARASYLAGCAGTSNVEAALRLGIPCVGTMAHSWVQSFEHESDSFESYWRVFPDSSTMLVDTYDTLEGVMKAAAIVPPIQAIRIDSGDLLDLGRKAREILDNADRPNVKILASGDLDEWSIAKLVASQTPFDGFGVGTEMITSRDAPALSLVYKLVAINGKGRIKLSPGKKTYPLGKQVFRRRDPSGYFLEDRVVRHDENTDGEPLLIRVVRDGKLNSPFPSLQSIRDHCRDQIKALPQTLLGPDALPTYPIRYSDALEDEAARLGVH